MIPTGVLGEQILVRAWVPLDDEHTMFWSISAPQAHRGGTRGTRSTQNGQVVAGTRGQLAYLPNTSDWLGRWRLAANATNDYGIDREVQRTQSYTGIEGIHLQDQAITESMEATVDRTQEHLGSSDAMVIRTRRRLIRMARALREGATPPGVDDPELYRVRSGGVILPRTADWQEATQALRQPFMNAPISSQEMSS